MTAVDASATAGITLHRLVLASCSSFLAEALRGREEATLLLPDVEREDFLGLVQVQKNIERRY